MRPFSSHFTLHTLYLIISLLLVCVSHAENLHGLHFDGRCHVATTNMSGIHMDQDYTVEVWVKPVAGSGTCGIFNMSTGWSSGSKCLALYQYCPEFRLYGVTHTATLAKVTSGQWSHVAWTAKTLGGGQFEYSIYVNGRFTFMFTGGGFADSANYLDIGRYAESCEYFVGDMVDLRYWNVVRSGQEIAEYMMAPPAGDTNLIAHWFYSSGDGTNVYDAAGNHDAHIYGGGSGTDLWVPVSPAPGVVSPTKKGLWIGDADVSKVSRAVPSSAQTNSWDNSPQAAGQSFPMRLIVHVDSSGGMRVLPEVYLAGSTEWVVATNYNGGVLTNAGLGTVVSNEVWSYGVYSSSNAIPQERQGQVQRISSVSFPVSADPMVMFGETNYYEGNVVVPYDDPMNPFVHVYHPDHDNKNAEGDKLGSGVESWTVTRHVTLAFSDTNPQLPNNPHWGVDRWGGVYRERIEGVYRYPLYVEGVFSLQKVNDVGVLD